MTLPFDDPTSLRDKPEPPLWILNSPRAPPEQRFDLSRS